MRLKEIAFTRYGPLQDFPRTELSSLTLFYGENERGKTLLVEAMLRVLFSKRFGSFRKQFPNIDRVDERPEGYLVLEVGGEELKLDGKRSLEEAMGRRLSWEDFRNVFVARDGDLSIAGERDYYGGVSERLIGSKAGAIARVVGKLRVLGRVTEKKLELSDSEDHGRAATRVAASRELMAEIEALSAELDESGFDGLEKRAALLEVHCRELERRLERMERAKAREEFQKARDKLDELIAVERKLDGLAGITEEGRGRWSEIENELTRLREEMDRKRAKLDQAKKRISELEKELSKLRPEFNELRARKEEIDNTIKPKLSNIESSLGEIKASEPSERLWRSLLIASSLLLFIALSGSIAAGSTLSGTLALIFAAVSALSAVKLVRAAGRRGRFEKELHELMTRSTSIHSGESSPAALRRSLERIEARYRLVQEALLGREGDRRNGAAGIEELEAEIESTRARIAALEGELEELKDVSGMRSLEEYRRAGADKRKLDKDRSSLLGSLEAMLGAAGRDVDPLDFWRRKIERGLKENRVEERFDAEELEHICSELEERRRERERILDELKSDQEKLQNMKARLEAAAVLEGPVLVRSTADLESIRDRLAHYCEEIEGDYVAACRAIEIFQDMEREEKEGVGSLFGPSQPVTRYFEAVTCGRYVEVGFDPDEGALRVKTADGAVLDARKLSCGARDQLYFSIRLSLAERLLGEEKGFFMLDDPFVRSDYGRLKEQVDLLKGISEKGWQVLYFTAKREVLELFERDIDRGTVRLVEMDGFVP